MLLEACPHKRERTLTRLSIAGALGDLAVPVLLAALALTGLGWRVALAVAAGAAALLAVTHACATALHRRLPLETDEAGATASIIEALRFAFSRRRLLAWSIAVALTSLLDEVLVAFAMIRLDDASPLERAIAVGAWTVGVLAGLFVLERWVDRVDSRSVLYASSALVAAALCALAFTSDPCIASAMLFALGASSSPLHPLASARAYASLPGRPALVNAVAAAFVPFDALAPLVLGALGLWLGPETAIVAIAIAPAGIAFATWRLADEP